MLYWAEGEKDRNALRFYNSDPEMVRFFVFFLKKYFDLRDEEIKSRATCSPTTFSDSVRLSSSGSKLHNFRSTRSASRT